MDTVALLASILTGIAFVVAGGSKLAAGDDWPRQARGLGAPAWSIPIVPWFELALGAVLVTQLARRPAALVAIATLLAFSALIAKRLSEGAHPPCACFGAWSSKPLSCATSPETQPSSSWQPCRWPERARGASEGRGIGSGSGRTSKRGAAEMR